MLMRACFLLNLYQGYSQIRGSLYMYPAQLILSMGQGFRKVTISQCFQDYRKTDGLVGQDPHNKRKDILAEKELPAVRLLERLEEENGKKGLRLSEPGTIPGDGKKRVRHQNKHSVRF